VAAVAIVAEGRGAFAAVGGDKQDDTGSLAQAWAVVFADTRAVVVEVAVAAAVAVVAVEGTLVAVEEHT
jgi:aminopeptidase-like protein